MLAAAGGGGLSRTRYAGPVLRRLRRHFRLVLVDNRGFGRSDRPTGSFTVADMADDVAAVLDAAGIRRAHVLGASLGGMAAQELAIRHPGTGRRPGAGLHDARLAVRLPDALGLGTAARCDRPPAGRDGAPHLVLHGGADAVVDPRNGRLLAARIPGARLVTFPGLGHLLFWEDPDGFAATVASFLLGLRPGS